MFAEFDKNKAKMGSGTYLIMISTAIIGSLIMMLFKIGNHLNICSASAVSEILFLLPVLVILVRNRFEILRGVKLNILGIKTILWTALFSLLLMPAGLYLNMLSQLLVPNAVSGTFIALTRTPFLLALVYYVFLPAVVEEFIFRGVLYQCFRPYGLWKAALIIAIFFGLAHLNLNQGLYGIFFGLFMVLLVEATGSIFAPMLLHFIVNLLNVALVYIETMNLPENMTSAMIEAQNETASASSLGMVYWVIIGIVAVAGVILGLIVLKKTAYSCGRDRIFSEALKGRDIRRGSEGKLFSTELILCIVIPFIYMGISLILRH